MANFFFVNDFKGNRLAINPDHIVSIIEIDEGALISLSHSPYKKGGVRMVKTDENWARLTDRLNLTT